MSGEGNSPPSEKNAPAPEAVPPPAAKSHGCLWLVILLLVAGLAIYGLHRRYPGLIKIPGSASKPAAPPPRRAVPVAVATARRGDLPLYLDAPGTVIALNTVTVRTRIDGQIMSVNYVEGGIVREGDLLVQIDPRPFQVQLTQAQGQLARDESLLNYARLDLARNQTAQKAIAQQQLDNARSLVGQYEGAVKTDQGQIDNANLQLTYCRVTAPISGKIGLRNVDRGNIVHASDAGGLAVITQVEPITVIFSLAEDYLPQVLKADRPGRRLPVEVLNRDKTIHLANGTLLAVDSQIDLPTLTARLKAIFPNKEHTLFPNQAVNVRLLVETRQGVVLIPAAAIQRSPQTTFAYVVKQDSTVELRPIKPGLIEGELASVDQGLAPGEVVVTAGVDNLAPGMKVSVTATPAPTATPVATVTPPVLPPAAAPRRPAP